MAFLKMGYSNSPGSKPLKRCIAYALNEKKTTDADGNRYVTGNMCIPEANLATETMISTKEQFDKMTGRQFYHWIVSFNPGEIEDKQEALDIIEEWAQNNLSAFEYVAGLHLDRDHIHAHIVFNSISYIAGEKFHNNKKDWEKMYQSDLDRVCKEHGLLTFAECRKDEPETSHEQTKADHQYRKHMDEKAGRWSWSAAVKRDIDECIMKCDNYTQVRAMLINEYGYEYNPSRKDSLKPPGKPKFMRLKTLGDDYTPENIEKRCSTKSEAQEDEWNNAQTSGNSKVFDDDAPDVPWDEEEDLDDVDMFLRSAFPYGRPPRIKKKFVPWSARDHEFSELDKYMYQGMRLWGMETRRQYVKKSPDYWETKKFYDKQKQQLVYCILNDIKGIDDLQERRRDLWVRKRALTKARDSAKKGSPERNIFNRKLNAIEDELHSLYRIQDFVKGQDMTPEEKFIHDLEFNKEQNR